MSGPLDPLINLFPKEQNSAQLTPSNQEGPLSSLINLLKGVAQRVQQIPQQIQQNYQSNQPMLGGIVGQSIQNIGQNTNALLHGKPMPNTGMAGQLYSQSQQDFGGFHPTPVQNQAMQDYATNFGLIAGEQAKPTGKITSTPQPLVQGVEDLPQILRGTKGSTAEDIMKIHPNIQLTKDVPATDIHGIKVQIPEGEKLTPYELMGNKILLQDGQTYIVSKNQFQNIKGNSIGGEAKPFAPELQGLEETVKGDLGYANQVRAKQGILPGEALTSVDLPKYSSYTLPGGENYREILIKSPYKSGDNYFSSSHWNEPNVISHIRLNDRTYNGQKVSFMEELQSDWAREGRDKGFQNSQDVTLAEKNYQEANKQWTDIQNKVYDNYKKTGKDPTPEMVDEGNRLRINAVTAQSLLNRVKNQIPNQPLLKNWQELSIKRGLKDAVDNNSDYFSWINGDQTSARYNLATQVENIDWGQNQVYPNTTRINIRPVQDKAEILLFVDRKGVVEHSGHSELVGKKLDEVLGKGLADNIMSKKTGTLSGEGLKFGGEWANNLYDKQVKDIVQNVTGGKVETIDMGLPIENTAKVDWMITDSHDRQTGTYDKLTPQKMELGMRVHTRGGVNGDNWTIVDVLGNSQFKAVPTGIYNVFREIPPLGSNEIESPIKTLESLRENENAQIFDISDKTKPSTQQAIKLTPEIKAKILGKAPDIKTSGKQFEPPVAPVVTPPVVDQPTPGPLGPLIDKLKTQIK